jgi:thiol-disulfide isomerase/thioredoxin
MNMARGLRILALLAIVGAAVAAMLFLGAPERATAPPAFVGHNAEFSAFPVLRPLPELSVTDAEGATVRLRDLKGRVVLLNFWATWCPPCVREMPSLDRLAAMNLDGLLVAAVSVDMTGRAAVEPFAAKHDLKAMTFYYDPRAQVMRALGLSGLPATFIVDREGRLAGVLKGSADWDTPEALALLQFYLDAKD